MRSHGKVDLNQGEIVKALEAIGCTVQSLASIGGGCPDLLVGFQGRNFVLEVKGILCFPNENQTEWIAWWRGQVSVVHTVDEALGAIGAWGSYSSPKKKARRTT